MNNTCLDSYSTTFSDRQAMQSYHEGLTKESRGSTAK